MLYSQAGVDMRVSASFLFNNVFCDQTAKFVQTLLYVTHPNYSFGGCSKGTLLGNIARYHAEP